MNNRWKIALGAGALALATTSNFALAQVAGGTLSLVAPYGSALKSLDPHATYASQDMAVSKAFHRALYTWDSAANAPALDLASEVAVSEDGLTYTYTLFDDTYFHNGRQMTADDVIWSYERILNPEKAFPGSVKLEPIVGAREYARGEAAHVAGLKKIDDLTFCITFAEHVEPGNLLFEAITAILPKEVADTPEFLSHPVGLGPFMFDKHVEGSAISGTKFDRYFKEGKPYADRVSYVITSDYSAMDMAFRAGEIDATVLSENVYTQYKADPELSKGLIEVSEVFTRHMGMNTEKKPFDDARVRQAINYAVDRDLIIQKLLKEKAFKANGWLPATSAAFDETRAPYPYDPAKAKALMAEAGYADGVEIEVMVVDSTQSLGVLQAMMPYLREIGITAKPRVVEQNVLVDAMTDGTALAWFRSTGTGPDDIAALRYFDSRVSRAAGNRSAYKNPEFDKVLDAAAAEVDHDKRVALIREAEGIVFNDAPVWFHNYNKAVLATQPWIHGVDANVTEAAILEVDSIWVDENKPNR